MDTADTGKQVVDLSQTQKIATQFREADTTDALLKATVWLDSIAKSRALSLIQRYESIDLLDAATRKQQKQIGDDYLALLHANRRQEKLLWETAQGFWMALSAAYLECMAEALNNPSSAGKLKAKLPILAARGVRAVAMRVKWVLFRFGLVEPQVWADLAQCQHFAEMHKIADKSVSLYLSNQTKNTVSEEFLRAVMLSAASMDSLSVMEQEIADRWIEYFASTFKLDSKPGKTLNLFFDLDRASPPRRVAGASGSDAHRRYFGASDALPQIQEFLEMTQKTGATPVPFRLPKGGEMKHVVKVLEHFTFHWGEQPPSREWDRRFTTTSIEVKHDYGSVRQTLENAELGELDFTTVSSRPEFWIVDNAGRGGYRAIVPKGMRSWLRLGALIAMRLEFRDFWSIAVIRRVESDEHQQRKVGIRMIARRPVTALMRSKERASTQIKPEPGILLNTKPSRDGGVHVLMRPGTFTLKEEIDVTFGPDNKQTMSLAPSKIVETAVDYEWVRYTVKN
ncbi:MAG: hypothetical protein ABL891_05255 [Burkholderiales bacterium]